jgi:hypothetical protein
MSYSSNGNRPKLSEKGLLTPDNCVVAHLWFQADYGIFYAGKFVKESQPGRNLNYWALWAGYKF